VSIVLRDRQIELVLLDIEGTTTPIAFVYDVLFPFARAHLEIWLNTHGDSAEGIEVVRMLAREHAEERRRGEAVPPWTSSASPGQWSGVLACARWLMDRDSKSPGLKRLQGLICAEGYAAGKLHGEVFPDVAPALRRWADQNVGVAIYSSGSELAQRVLFASTAAGDLTPFILAHFDTAVGAKAEPDSYRRIAAALGRAPAAVLFVSDVTSELAAASEAGQQVVLSVRPGNRPQHEAFRYETIQSFNELI
jgi:enolase-phosphatase E1